jgi:hypothetical protein
MLSTNLTGNVMPTITTLMMDWYEGYVSAEETIYLIENWLDVDPEVKAEMIRQIREDEAADNMAIVAATFPNVN